MISTNETKATSQELNVNRKETAATQERYWDFLHGCWKYGPVQHHGWDFRYRG